MELKYILNRNFGTIEDRDLLTIALTDNLDLMLSFKLPNAYRENEQYIVILENGKKKRKLTLNNLSVDLPKELLFAGRIKVSFVLIVDGKISKEWICENILIRDVEFSTKNIIEILPELQELKNDIAQLQQAVLELYKDKQNQGGIL